MEYIELSVVNVRRTRKLKLNFNMDFFLFIYGLVIVLVFSMLTLSCYQSWINKKGSFVDFFVFAVIDIITIIAFMAKFTN